MGIRSVVAFLGLFLNLRAQVPNINFKNEELYYKSPTIGIENMNITFGMAIPISRNSGTAGYQETLGEAIACICQADQINQGLYKLINFNGTMNMAVQTYYVDDSVGQVAYYSLIGNSIYNSTSGKPISPDGITNLAAIVGILSEGRNRINSESSAGFGIPFMNPGSIDGADLSERYAISNSAGKRTVYDTRQTEIYTNVDAVIDFMLAMNWTIGSNVFQSNVLGFVAEKMVQVYESENSSPIFACGNILTEKHIDSDLFYQQYCECITKINTLNVVNLWLTEPASFVFIKRLKANCKAAKNFVFIVTSDDSPAGLKIANKLDPSDYESILIMRQYGPWDFQAYVDNCLETGTPQARATVEMAITELLATSYNCYKATEENSDLPICSDDVSSRTIPCICTGFELNPYNDPYAAQNFFFVDSISVLGYALALLQNNCTYVSKAMNVLNKEVEIDYCKYENLTPTLLANIMVLANFTGYTGPISFPPGNSIVRASKFVEVYTIVNKSLINPVLVGNFSAHGYVLNYSAISLPNGNNTISKLVPENPGLDDGAIAAFFGVFTFLLILGIIAFVILIRFRKHILIRRNTPNISIIVLCGTILTTISGILLCLDTSTAICILIDMMYSFGFSTIMGGIIAKEYRIYKIFSNQSASAVDIKDWKLFLIIAAIVFYFTMIAAVEWITGLRSVILQSDTNKYYFYYQCIIPTKFWNAFLAIFSEVSFILLQISAVLLAWNTRKINSSFSESRQVFVFVVLVLCANIVLIPLYETLYGGSNAIVLKRVLRLIKVLVIVLASLILLFYYRFWLVYKYEKIKEERRI